MHSINEESVRSFLFLSWKSCVEYVSNASNEQTNLCVSVWKWKLIPYMGRRSQSLFHLWRATAIWLSYKYATTTPFSLVRGSRHASDTEFSTVDTTARDIAVVVPNWVMQPVKYIATRLGSTAQIQKPKWAVLAKVIQGLIPIRISRKPHNRTRLWPLC